MQQLRGKRKSPFGWALARLRKHPEWAESTAIRVFGPDLGAALWNIARWARVSGEGHGRKVRRDEPRRKARELARFVCLAIRLLEHTDPGRLRALTGDLWLGPAKGYGGLAGYLGLSRRQLLRYERALRPIVKAHRPPVAALPEHLKGPPRADGTQYPYAAWTWQAPLPRRVAAYLAGWRWWRIAVAQDWARAVSRRRGPPIAA